MIFSKEILHQPRTIEEIDAEQLYNNEAGSQHQAFLLSKRSSALLLFDEWHSSELFSEEEGPRERGIAATDQFECREDVSGDRKRVDFGEKR